jgi:PBP1b-binding outer membrane lipoprotein LpoB
MKIFITLLLIISLFNGCGSNNSTTTIPITSTNNDTTNNVTLDNNITIAFTNGNSKTLTTNSEVYTVEVAVFGPDNAPYNSGKVKIAYPNKVKTGVLASYY